jgi:T5SS/PEP-CTERM-associated repeat protein
MIIRPESGALSVVGPGTLDQCGDIFVGYKGSGKLTITNGGFVNTFFNPSIASLQNSNGSVSVDGQNQNGTKSQWTVAGELEVGGVYNGRAGGTGLLSVTNSGKVTAATIHVWKSGTLTGNSTVSTTNTDGTTIEGTLKPNGTLTVGGNLRFNGTAPMMQCNVVPTSADNVQVSSGTALLTGRLSVTMTGNFPSNITQFTLLHSSGTLTGTFGTGVSITYPPNEGFTPQITYDYVGNNVFLDLVFNQ